MSTNANTVRTTRRRLLAAADRRDLDEPCTVPALSGALSRLVQALDEAAEAAGWGTNPPALVRVTDWPSSPPADGFDLGVRPIDSGQSVVEALTGFVAP